MAKASWGDLLRFPSDGEVGGGGSAAASACIRLLD